MKSITAQQSRDARRELGLSQADVTKTLGLNRQYLSELESGYTTRLTNPQLKKLRAFYESKIAEANKNGEGITLTFGFEDNSQEFVKPVSISPITDLTKPEGIQHTLLAVRHLAIDQSLNTEQINDILEKIAANDRDAEGLLNEKAERGFVSAWSEQTDSYLKQVFGLFAANYVLMRHLQGRPLVVLEKSIEDDDIDTVATLFANLFHKENGDLVKEDQQPDIPTSSEEDAS